MQTYLLCLTCTVQRPLSRDLKTEPTILPTEAHTWARSYARSGDATGKDRLPDLSCRKRRIE